MKENNILKCPVCNLPLGKSDLSLICSNKHTFDISKEGYINLLLSNQKKSKHPGDSKVMLLHRRNFLNKGYYSNLLQEIFEIIQEYLNNKNSDINILDIGCGEGYYTCNLSELIRPLNKEVTFYGVDISKDAVFLASKKCKQVNFIVGNDHFLPFTDKTFDITFSIFSPVSTEEVSRVSKDDAVLIMAGPGKKHLFEFIELIYDKPRLHESNNEMKVPSGFELISEKEVNYTLDLKDKDDIRNLFSMTPYYWQPSLEKQQKILNLEQLKIEINFDIKVFQKKSH